MMAKGTFASINLATSDVDGAFERLQVGDAEVVQEPTDQPYGIRDCAFRDPAGNLIRIQQRGDRMNATPTLYEWAGGEAAIRRLMDCFYNRVERDELLALLSRRGERGAPSAREHLVVGGAGRPRPLYGGLGRLREDARSPSRPRDCTRGAASLRLAAQLPPTMPAS